MKILHELEIILKSDEIKIKLNNKCNLHDKLFKSSSHTFFLKVLSKGVNFRSKGSEFQTFAPRKANDLCPVESRQCGKLRSLL